MRHRAVPARGGPNRHPIFELVVWKRDVQLSSAPSMFMIGIKIVLNAVKSCGNMSNTGIPKYVEY